MEPVEFVDLETTELLVNLVDIEELERQLEKMDKDQRIFPSDMRLTFTI